MNIFVTDTDPVKSAIVLDDARVIKMVLETAQMMSTIVHKRFGLMFDSQYKSTHSGHRCTVWAGSNRSNFCWLGEHGLALANEHQRRFPKSKRHKSAAVIENCLSLNYEMPQGSLTPFANSARRQDLDLDFSGIPDTIQAYRLYLEARWALETPRFTNASPPDWK